MPRGIRGALVGSGRLSFRLSAVAFHVFHRVKPSAGRGEGVAVALTIRHGVAITRLPRLISREQVQAPAAAALKMALPWAPEGAGASASVI